MAMGHDPASVAMPELSEILSRPWLERASAFWRSAGSFSWPVLFDAEGPPDFRASTWKLGYSMGSKLFWEDFEDQPQAEQ